MPCRDDGRAADEAHAMIQTLQRRLDGVTRMLCEMIAMHGWHTHDQQLWWEAHEEADSKRRLMEERAKHAEQTRKQSRIAALERELAELKGAK